MEQSSYRIFARNWWKRNKDWPGGREPHLGRRHTIGWAESEKAARDMARIWNANHPPGFMSRKAEYERA